MNLKKTLVLCLCASTPNEVDTAPIYLVEKRSMKLEISC